MWSNELVKRCRSQIKTQIIIFFKHWKVFMLFFVKNNSSADYLQLAAWLFFCDKYNVTCKAHESSPELHNQKWPWTTPAESLYLFILKFESVISKYPGSIPITPCYGTIAFQVCAYFTSQVQNVLHLRPWLVSAVSLCAVLFLSVHLCVPFNGHIGKMLIFS